MATSLQGRAIVRPPRRHGLPDTRPRLDAYDIAILSALIRRPRATAAELAGIVHLSRTAVTRRINTLIESGVLDRLQQATSFEDVGLGIRASVELSSPSGSVDEICRKLAEFPEVIEIIVLSGCTTLVLDVVAVDIPHLRHFICSITELSDTATRIVFSRYRSPMSLRQRLALLKDRNLLDETTY